MKSHCVTIQMKSLSHGAICLAGFEKLKILIFVEFLLWPLLAVKGLTRAELESSLWIVVS